MGAVLLLLLRILLIIIGVLLLLFLLLMSVRTGVEAVGVDGEIAVDLRWGVLRIPIYPRTPKPPKEEKPEKEKPEKAPKEKKPPKYRYSFNREAFELGEIIDVVLTLLDELTGTLRFSRLRVRVLIGTDDAAKTGMRLGQASAVIGMLTPVLENTFDMHDYQITVDADFDATTTTWAFTVFCSLRPIALLGVLARHGKEYWKLYKKLIKKEEATNYE